MNVTTTYPGTYISEAATTSFSIGSSATAVPLFAFNEKNKIASKSVQIYNNWAEFTQDYPGAVDEAFYHSLKLWFMHGGGKCYLVATADIQQVVERYDDITLLVAAGVGEEVFEPFSTLTSHGYRIFALFDGPDTKIGSNDEPNTIMQAYPTSSYAAVFYPSATLTSGGSVPPSAIAAASIVQTDHDCGVWKAPANQVVNGVTPNYLVSDDVQGRFNEGKALNMIRTFSGTGTVVWGARTLEDSDNWRYIPVRRLFNTVERDMQKALNKLVFEPNSQPTWQRVQAAADSYLYRLWQQGALVGANEKEAWFVQVGKDITMTTEDINNGKLIVKIGLAAVRPAEFIILSFSQDIAQ